MSFCSPFDERLAREGPPAVFLFDPDGELRFDAEWTRDAYARVRGPMTGGGCWILARDRDSGWVQLVYATSPDLLRSHPRLDVRPVRDAAEGKAARAALGPVPVVTGSW